MKRARWFDKLTMDGGGLLTTCLLAALLLLAGLSSAGVVNAVEFGANWSEVGTDALPVALASPTALTFDDQLWVIGGRDITGLVASRKVYSSSDGATWAEVGTDALPAGRDGHCSVVFNGKMWVIGGRDNTAGYDNVYASSDGATWTEAAPFPIILHSASCLVANSKIYLFGGESSDVPGGVSERVYSSADGETWTEEGTNALPVALFGTTAVFFNDSFYLIGGRQSDGTVVDTVYRSSDAQTWTQVGTLPDARYIHASVKADGQMWVAGGADNSLTQRRTVFSSMDGETWVTVGDDPLPFALVGPGLAFFKGKIYLAAGKSGGTASRKVFSTDDIAGAEALTAPSDTVSEFANEIPAVDQSGDTANSDLPILELAAAEEAETGWPLVT